MDDGCRTMPLSQTLPEDILRIILEASIIPGKENYILLSESTRLSLAYKLCLISKRISSWIEPLLYRAISLETDKQVASFIYALNFKSSKFLCQHVRALWILNNGNQLYRLNFEPLFSTMKNLEKLALSWHWFVMLSTITTPSSIRHLTLVRPQGSFERLQLRHLSLRSLHIIDPAPTFIADWINASLGGIGNPTNVHHEVEDMHARLEAIPRICLEFTKIQPYSPVGFLRKLANVLKMQEQKSRSQPSSPLNNELDTVSLAEPRSLWFKSTPYTETLSGLSVNIPTHDLSCMAQAAYNLDGPHNRPIGVESPLSVQEEFRRYCEMSWFQRVREAIRYNELRWDVVARTCTYTAATPGIV